jgi:hypothetical protein
MISLKARPKLIVPPAFRGMRKTPISRRTGEDAGKVRLLAVTVSLMDRTPPAGSGYHSDHHLIR